MSGTAQAPGVTAAAGPYPVMYVTASLSFRGATGAQQEELKLTGRTSPGGAVDDLSIDAGHWPRAAGQVVWARSRTSQPVTLGQTIRLTGVTGAPALTVVGLATSVTGTAQAWVLPSEIRALHGRDLEQMLYRFADAGTAAQVGSDVTAIRRALPAGALAGPAQSWLTAQQLASTQITPWVPFMVAFGVIALVMSVLIVVNVVSGAVVSGTRRIGVLKSVGFTPGQVVAAYVLQAAVPALAGCLSGAIIGDLLAVPLLNRNAQVYGVGVLFLPQWLVIAVPAALFALTVITAVVPALRAGRMTATQAITAGRAPRSPQGIWIHRLAGTVRGLPRPVTIGLAEPFARPSRTLVTATAILFGAAAVTFGAGLAVSLARAEADISRTANQPVQVLLSARTGPATSTVRAPARTRNPAAGAGSPANPAPKMTRKEPATASAQLAVTTALLAQPGTLRYVAETDDQFSVPALPNPMQVTAYDGDAGWTGWAIIAGRWYSGPGQADVNTYFLTETRTSVGSTYTLSAGGRTTTVRIVGEVFDPGSTASMILSSAALASVAPGLMAGKYDVGLRPGANVQSYVNALSARLGPGYAVTLNTSRIPEFASVLALVPLLTALIIAVAALGVLNTVMLQIRERARDLGVFKALGMTPRQTLAMIVSSVTGTGLAAGILAIPAGVALHSIVVPVMGHAAQTSLPPGLTSVYRAPELILLALSGVLIAIAGALGPAITVAQTRTITALRTE